MPLASATVEAVMPSAYAWVPTREQRGGRDEPHGHLARAVVDPAPDAVVALGDDGERGAGDEARHAGHRVQRQDQAVAVEDEREVVPAPGAVHGERERVGPADLRDEPGRETAGCPPPRGWRASTRPPRGAAARCQVRSVARVSAQPRTRASCSEFISLADRHRRARNWRRSAGTRQAASSAIAPDIFDSPSRRSWKTIGSSATRRPARSAR